MYGLTKISDQTIEMFYVLKSYNELMSYALIVSLISLIWTGRLQYSVSCLRFRFFHFFLLCFFDQQLSSASIVTLYLQV